MTTSIKNDIQAKLIHRVGVIGPGEPGKTAVSFNAVHKLSDKEYKAYKDAVNELRAWATSDEYLLIRYSYQSLQQTMRRCAILYSQTPTPSNPHSVKLAINADFLNLLSNARLYLDHTETQLKRAKHDKKDNELAEFKRVTAHEYDNVFAYRFCYKLRNYALYCGFPITGFSAHSGFVEGTQEKEHSFEATFKDEIVATIDMDKLDKKDQIGKLEEQQSVKQAQIDYAMNFMGDAHKLWIDANVSMRQGFQRAIFPEGVVLDTKSLRFGTSKISSLYRYAPNKKDLSAKEKSLVVTSRGIEPRLPG